MILRPSTCASAGPRIVSFVRWFSSAATCFCATLSRCCLSLRSSAIFCASLYVRYALALCPLRSVTIREPQKTADFRIELVRLLELRTRIGVLALLHQRGAFVEELVRFAPRLCAGAGWRARSTRDAQPTYLQNACMIWQYFRPPNSWLSIMRPGSRSSMLDAGARPSSGFRLDVKTYVSPSPLAWAPPCPSSGIGAIVAVAVVVGGVNAV